MEMVGFESDLMSHVYKLASSKLCATSVGQVSHMRWCCSIGVPEPVGKVLRLEAMGCNKERGWEILVVHI